MLLQQQISATLLQPEIKALAGNPLEFSAFMQAFKYLVENKTTSDTDVKGFLNRRSTTAYEEAKVSQEVWK